MNIIQRIQKRAPLLASILLLSFLTINLSTTALGCTLFAVTGDGWGKNESTFIIKNRDWRPEKQELRVIKSSGKLSYVGIFGEAPWEAEGWWTTSGINEKGLVIIISAASSVPATEETKNLWVPGGVVAPLLANCSSVDEALQQDQWLTYPQNLLLADNKEIALVEIGPNGEKNIRRTSKGYLAHTNHYLENPEWNLRTPTLSSIMRQERIEELLQNGQNPYNRKELLEFARDHVGSANSSIFRTGETEKSTRTISTFAVEIPKNGTPKIFFEVLGADRSLIEVNFKSLDSFFQ